LTTIVALVTLLLAPAASGAAEAPAASTACQTFSRSTQPAPPLVREWFARSPDERVVVCPQTAAPGNEAAAPLYFGEGAVRQRGAVCSYLSHGLTRAGSGDTARLEHYEHSEALAMALAGSDCPRPHAASAAADYVETYDVSPAAFVGIMRLWSATTATLAAAGPSAAGARMAPEARDGLETIGPGRVSSASVTRIVRIPGSVLRHRYALFLKVPDTSSGNSTLYVVYVDKSLRGPYEITALAETN
jgi:hypothetical protein